MLASQFPFRNLKVTVLNVKNVVDRRWVPDSTAEDFTAEENTAEDFTVYGGTLPNYDCSSTAEFF